MRRPIRKHHVPPQHSAIGATDSEPGLHYLGIDAERKDVSRMSRPALRVDPLEHPFLGSSRGAAISSADDPTPVAGEFWTRLPSETRTAPDPGHTVPRVEEHQHNGRRESLARLSGPRWKLAASQVARSDKQ